MCETAYLELDERIAIVLIDVAIVGSLQFSLRFAALQV